MIGLHCNMRGPIEELKTAWLKPGSDIYLSQNWREIKKYCEKYDIDLEKKAILKFIESNRSSELKVENGNEKIRQVSTQFVYRPRFFSQIHGDIFMLTKKRSYNTANKLNFLNLSF